MLKGLTITLEGNKERKSQKIQIQDLEIVHKDVIHYPGTASRVIVPKDWKRVALLRLE